ncbi:NPCBM/NEW2 domain-containing protein [Streptomyces sp. NPDC013455]|uniref:NPCBM/NEW2 domain-containing protein n=1 Tax=Streptomyces sp. NPDC013455 TaxID=3155605 RepID=UPI0033E3DAC8
MAAATPPDDGVPPLPLRPPPTPSPTPSPAPSPTPSPAPSPPPPPPSPTPSPTPSPPPPSARRLGEIAALISAVTAVLGLLLGFFGLPTLVNSPTARTVTATTTVTATATVTASPRTADTGAPSQSSGPAPLPSGEVALRDLTPLGSFPDEHFQIRTVTLGGKAYSNAMVVTYPCVSSWEYSINERYKTLTLTVGLDDNGVAEPGKLSIKGDGKARKNIMLEINHPQTVTVDVSGVVKLGIDPEFGDSSSCNADGVVVALADAVLRS